MSTVRSVVPGTRPISLPSGRLHEEHGPEVIAKGVDAGFQYPSRRYEAETALSGMWLFLATEVLFFGGIVWSWVVFRAKHPAGFHAAAEHTNLLIGSINTALLVTSSFLFTRGVRAAERGRNDEVFRACVYHRGPGSRIPGVEGDRMGSRLP